MPLTGAAVVTGGSSGIGYHVCKTLGDAGMNVVVADVDTEPRADVPPISEVFDGYDAALVHLKTDVTDEQSVESLFDTVPEVVGGFSALVNNAGVFETGSVTELSKAQWNRSLGVNLTGIFHCCKHGIPLLEGATGASIVNVGSIYGVLGGVGNFGYTASKGGVVAITRQLAAEYGPRDIRTNAVLPGFIRTQMLADDTPEGASEYALGRTPLGRLGEPEEVADAIRFLVSPDASYVNGQTLAIDGGFGAV